MLAQVKYTILKNGNRVVSGNKEACEELNKGSKDAMNTLTMFGLPNKCPIQKVRNILIIFVKYLIFVFVSDEKLC